MDQIDPKVVGQAGDNIGKLASNVLGANRGVSLEGTPIDSVFRSTVPQIPLTC